MRGRYWSRSANSCGRLATHPPMSAHRGDAVAMPTTLWDYLHRMGGGSFMGISIAIAIASSQTFAPATPSPATSLSLGDFMRACVSSGGDLGWFPAVAVGTSASRSVYTSSTSARVTVSFHNEDGLGSAEVRYFIGTTENQQPMSIPESLTVVSGRVRYGVSSTRSPTAVCTRVH